jgi:hypothetical protein
MTEDGKGCFCGVFYDGVSRIYRVEGLLMNDEMEVEVVVALWRYCLAICLEGLRKTMKALGQDN